MIRLFALILILLTSHVSLAESDASTKTKRVLVFVGYTDEENLNETLAHPFSKKHSFSLAYRVELGIKRSLIDMGMNFQSDSLFLKKDNSLEVTIFNVNVLCPGESLREKNLRSNLCYHQIQRSEQAVKYLERNLNKFDEFIYIGHARKGAGLALGPFVPEYTYPLKFYNSVDQGRLKKIVLASCSSQSFYSPLAQRFDFVGTSDRLLLFKDLLPLVQGELRKLIQAP
ncbi:hypothetical protein D3C87_253560 [compost metagenome]